MRTRRTLALAAVLMACRPTPTEHRADFFGRWQKLEQSLPPITLELRRGATGAEGQVWLSGTTYTLPATFVGDTSVVLADPASSRLAPFVGVLEKDGRLRVRLDGQPPVEAHLVRMGSDAFR
jgi:hypothetical protein